MPGGARRGERVVFEVVQGEDGLDDGGAAPRAAPQLRGQGFPVLELRVPALADAAQLGLQPVRGPLGGRELPAARPAPPGDDFLVQAEVAQVSEQAEEGEDIPGDACLPGGGDVDGWGWRGAGGFDRGSV